MAVMEDVIRLFFRSVPFRSFPEGPETKFQKGTTGEKAGPTEMTLNGKAQFGVSSNAFPLGSFPSGHLFSGRSPFSRLGIEA